MTQYVEIKVNVANLYSEMVAEILSSYGCNGIVLSEEYYSGSLAQTNNEYIKAYLPYIPENKNILDNIKHEIQTQRSLLMANNITNNCLGTWEVTFNNVDDQDWAESWKKYWHAEKITPNIIICPSWETWKNKKDTDIIIDLDPGSAFGTGTHPTTRLCIKAIEDFFTNNDNKNINMLDVGTGSGILSIVSAKLGAKYVFGNDIDPLSIDVAQENSKKNNTENICHFSNSSIRELNKEFDIVVANILAKVIISMSVDLQKTTKKGGTLILSGIISSKVNEITSTFDKLGFKILFVNNEEDWVAIVAQRV